MAQPDDQNGIDTLVDTRPVAVVHIGLNKTGTTTIQSWLTQNQAALAERGIYYDDFAPEIPGALGAFTGFPAHALSRIGRMAPRGKIRRAMGIGQLSDQQAKTAEFAARVHDRITASGCSKVIISTECIAEWLNHPTTVAALDDWLREEFRHVVYVLYLRDQADWAASAYAQSVKSGATHSVDAFLEKRGTYNFHALVQAWLRGIDGKRLRIRLLTPDFLEDGDLLTDFAKTAGIDPTGLQRPPRRNESPAAANLALMRLSNRALGWAMGEGRVQGWNQKLARLPLGGRKFALTPAQRAKVITLNAATNEKLRARAFRDRATLFSDAPDASAPHSPIHAPRR